MYVQRSFSFSSKYIQKRCWLYWTPFRISLNCLTSLTWPNSHLRRLNPRYILFPHCRCLCRSVKYKTLNTERFSCLFLMSFLSLNASIFTAIVLYIISCSRELLVPYNGLLQFSTLLKPLHSRVAGATGWVVPTLTADTWSCAVGRYAACPPLGMPGTSTLLGGSWYFFLGGGGVELFFAVRHSALSL